MIVGVEGAVQSVGRLREPALRDHAAGRADGRSTRCGPRSCTWVLWVNFGLTIVATLYFGWHYIADDIAGIMIALIAFYVGGIASGQKFDSTGSPRTPPPRPPQCRSSTTPDRTGPVGPARGSALVTLRYPY
jgi:hypothetical protein